MPWTCPVTAAEIRRKAPRSLTPEWFQARRGRLTASKRAEIIAIGKPQEWAAMADDIDDEIHPDWVHKDVDAPPLRWGRDHEKDAIIEIISALDTDLVEPGLILHPMFGEVGSTPDGFIDGNTTVQIKCPYRSANHLQTLLDGKLNSTYYWQVQWEAWTSGRTRIIFASFDPRQKGDRRLCLLDVPVNDDHLRLFERRVVDFFEYYDARPKTPKPAAGKVAFEGVSTNLF